MFQPALVQIQRNPIHSINENDDIASRLPTFLTPTAPSVYTLELIAACNHKCIGCGNVFSRQLKRISAMAWRKIIASIKPHVESFRITGGECTLHPEFREIIEIVDSVDVPFVVFTNGNWRNVDEILDVFGNCKNLDGLLISLHGKSAESFRRFVVSDAFEKVIENIRKAVERGIRVGSNTILLKSNHRDVSNIINLAISLGVSSVAFSRYYGKPIKGLQLSDGEFENALGVVNNKRKEDKRVVFNNCVPMCFSDIDIPTKGCTSGFTHATIDPLGTVRPCTHSPYELGNVFESSVEEIWRSRILRKWRNLIPSGCLECGSFNACRGGCRATAVHQGLTMDPLIQGPMHHKQKSKETLRLFRHARPKPRFSVRKENFGYHLINRNRHVAISDDAIKFIKPLDGKTTLETIHNQFGQIALDFVGTLLNEGLVELA